jgi:S-adenosylmethionine hydrolase
MRIITLTTDFGLSDWFVGTMKGVILSIHPGGATVDISHDIPAGDVHTGAFALAASYKFFPKGTIHVAIVDPGVGGKRKAIAVQTADYLFVGPDNGVLSFALAKEKIKSIRQLTNETVFLAPVSRTFHGRDIFAPVAAHLSKGLSPHLLGPKLTDFVRLPWPKVETNINVVRGRIVYIDRFGNAITSIDQSCLSGLTGSACEVFVRQKRVCPLATFYQAVQPGKPVAILGSSDLLEIAVNGGSAARILRLRIGDAVVVRRLIRPYHSSSA